MDGFLSNLGDSTTKCNECADAPCKKKGRMEGREGESGRVTPNEVSLPCKRNMSRIGNLAVLTACRVPRFQVQEGKDQVIRQDGHTNTVK